MKKFQKKEWLWIVLACSFFVLTFTEKQIMYSFLGFTFLVFTFDSFMKRRKNEKISKKE
ncbi:hypothetical protein IAG15_09805 [Enterococcus faecalis]|nr:hypothetical protein [Enterococcus faecalis]